MFDIPFDILHEILLRLPAGTLLRFRNVCKLWRSIIDDPSFVRSHSIKQNSNCSTLLIRDKKDQSFYSLSLETLNHTKDGVQTIEAAPIKELIGKSMPSIYSLPAAVCNGLILIYSFDIERNWVIWNPLTQDFLELPIPDTELQSRFSYEFVGMRSMALGYDHSTDDYKVVRIHKLERGSEEVLKTLVYSLKLGFWREGKDIPFDICGGKGVFLNGALYWRSRGNEIVMFDLGTEDYTKFRGPPLSNGGPLEKLEVMNGCLFLSCYYYNMRSLEGWIMRDDAVEKSWMKLFSISSPMNVLQPFAYFKKKRLVILHESCKGLFWFDLESNILREVRVKDMPNISGMQFFPESLFRLNKCGGVAAAGVKRKRTLR